MLQFWVRRLPFGRNVHLKGRNQFVQQFSTWSQNDDQFIINGLSIFYDFRKQNQLLSINKQKFYNLSLLIDKEIFKKQMNKSTVSEPNSPQLNHHRRKAIKLITELTKTQKSKKSQQLEYKVKTLHEINKQIEASMKKNPILAEVFATDQLIVYIRYYFVQNISRCPCLTFFRLIMVSQQVTKKYLCHNLPVYIARLIEKQQPKSKNINHEDEIHEALKLIADWVNKFPSTFPKLLLSTLISFAELPVVQGFQERKKDHIPIYLKQLVMDILINLSVKSTKMFAFSGGFTLLSNAMIDPILAEKSQSISHLFIYFSNEKKNRDYVSDYINMKKMFSIFTDLDNTFLEDSSKTKGNMENSTKFQKQLQLGKRGILSLIKSWTGVIYLGNQDHTLRSFLQALKQIPKKQDSQIRKVIFEIIEQILAIGDNLITSESLLLTQHQFRVTNLVNCYVVTLIQLLLENDLFKILIELSGMEESLIAEPAQKLLKKLSIYIFNFLPDCADYIDFLISAATKTDPTSLILKSSSSFIMSKIGNYIYEKSAKIKNQELNELQVLFNLNSIYVSSGRSNINAISKTLHTLTYRENQTQRVELINSNPIMKQHKQDHKKWNWDVIEELFSFPDRFKDSSKLDSHEKHKESKIFKYLLRFYSHTRGSFSELKWTNENFQYAKVGKLFIRTAISVPQMLPLVKNPPESQFECTVSFMGELQKLLQTTLIGCGKIRNNFYQPFFKYMQRQLLLWIGLFSENKVGYEVLLCENNFFQLLYEFIDHKECSLVIFGLMLYLDFYRENMSKKVVSSNSFQSNESKYIVIGPKALLKKCVKQGSKELKILSLQIIKLLFKAELSSFASDGFKMLLYLLALEDEETIQEVLQTIELLLSENSNIAILLSCLMEEESKQQGLFNTLKQRLQRSNKIIIRLLSVQIGYDFVIKKLPNWIEQQYTRWLNIDNENNYCMELQTLLAQTLNFVQRKQSQYKIQNCKNIYELGFMYKLPWIIYVNDEEVGAKVKMTPNKFILYHNFNNEKNYESLQDYSQNTIKVCLGVGSHFMDHNLKYKKDKVIKELELNKGKQTILFGQKLLVTQTDGIKIYYNQIIDEIHIKQESSQSYNSFPATGYFIKRIQLEIKIYFEQQNNQLPLHLVQELTKTRSGLDFLTSKHFLQHTQKVLQNQKSTPLQLRSTLWSLGYYGSTKLGITQLIDKNIADKIIRLSFQCDTLSLRGTCRYVLNMWCHSQTGRNFMSLRGFVVNKKSLNCFPKDYKRFFTIKKTKYVHYSQNDAFWQMYQSFMKPMNENEQKLFGLVSQLINALSYKQAIGSVKEMMKSNMKVIHSYSLLQNVLNLLSCYKFRNDARKNIYMIFEEFFRSPEFNTTQLDKISYITSRQIDQLPFELDQAK